MTVLEIWDFISGTSDANPADASFSTAVNQLIVSRAGKKRCKILDLGGGAGNPSISLAQRGHDVTLVDGDINFVATARARALQANSPIQCVHEDWRQYLGRQREENAIYDVVLFLGNALAYQDSWPDRQSTGLTPADAIRPTLASCRSIIAPEGVILLESAFEPTRERPWSYVRYFPSKPTNHPTGAAETVWLVDCDPLLSTRLVDTFVTASRVGQTAQVVGRVPFRSHLITQELISNITTSVGFAPHFDIGSPRTAFTMCALRPL